MHQISNLRVENFKSIIEAEFPLAAYTPLVGYNNAGKTNILNAVSWLIKKSSLPAADFNDPEKLVSVSAKIVGIDEDVLAALGDTHRPKIEPLVINKVLHIKREQSEPDAKAKDMPLQVLKQTDAGDMVWAVNPAGIDAAISQLFPEPVFIGAMENATEDVAKFGTSTTIGKLIKEIITPITETHAAPVNDALADIASKLSADSPDKDQNLINLDAQIQNELAKFFPGVRAKTHIPTPEFGDFLKGATIKIFEDEFANPNGRDAGSFGHGAQRSVQIALVKCLSEIKRNTDVGAGRTTLLLIDEPELYLHPQAVELVRASLSRLSVEGYQVLFSTHSPAMISREDAPNTLLIRRNKEAGTRAYPRIRDAVQATIDGAQSQSETLFTLTNAAKVLFSERVVLAEGATEQRLLPEVFCTEIGSTLDENKIGLVALGGVENVPNAMKVLRAMGIPTKAVVDLDFAFRAAIKQNMIPADHAGVVGCLSILTRLEAEKKCTLSHGLPVNETNGTKAAAAYTMMANEPDAEAHIRSIHDHLKNEGIWCWCKGAIETHLDLSSKKPAAHLAFLTKLQDQNFRNGLPDYKEVQQMLAWLQAA